MTSATDMFIRHTEDVLTFARQIFSNGMTVYGYECNNVDFGTWSVVAGIERERFQFNWDGRALKLTISEGLLVDGRREWEPIHTLNVRHSEAVSRMEMFLNEKFVA